MKCACTLGSRAPATFSESTELSCACPIFGREKFTDPTRHCVFLSIKLDQHWVDLQLTHGGFCVVWVVWVVTERLQISMFVGRPTIGNYELEGEVLSILWKPAGVVIDPQISLKLCNSRTQKLFCLTTLYFNNQQTKSEHLFYCCIRSGNVKISSWSWKSAFFRLPPFPMRAPEANLPEDLLNGDKLACRFGHASKEICWQFEVGTRHHCYTKEFWLRCTETYCWSMTSKDNTSLAFIQERLYSVEHARAFLLQLDLPACSSTVEDSESVGHSYLFIIFRKAKQNARSYTPAWWLERTGTSSLQTYRAEFWKEKQLRKRVTAAERSALVLFDGALYHLAKSHQALRLLLKLKNLNFPVNVNFVNSLV